jgi:hypothetical protein
MAVSAATRDQQRASKQLLTGGRGGAIGDPLFRGLTVMFAGGSSRFSRRSSSFCSTTPVRRSAAMGYG